MQKSTLLLALLFFGFSIAAQSNLIIDGTNIPVKIKGDQIRLKKGETTTLRIPTNCDTIVTFNPETNVELIEFVCSGQVTEQTTLHTVDSKTTLDRNAFLGNPMIYISHNQVDYVPYRLFLFYFDKGEFRCMGFYDTATLQYFKDYNESAAPYFYTLLRYFNNTTLQDFKYQLGQKLSRDATEIYIKEAEFVSSKTDEKLILKNPVKVTLQ